MAYTTNQLISAAYYASGVVSREFETVSGFQIADGLQWLNDILGEKRVDDGMIPYETTYNFNSIVGQEKYFIPNLIQIDTLVFYLDNVRYSMNYSKRNEYFGTPRVENIQTLPYHWYFERRVGGGNLYIYFQPNQNYPMSIKGIFNLNSVALGQDLSANTTTADLGVPTFYFGTSTSLNRTASLAPGQLVVSTPNLSPDGANSTAVDLMGNYPNIGALVNYINSGIIPGVMASIVVNDFVLTSTTEPPTSIQVQSTGYPGGTTFIGNVAAAQNTGNLSANYNNGNNGIGATLTATTAAVLIIDFYTVQLNDIVLIATQNDPTQNGVYTLTTLGTVSVPWVLTRATNYNQAVQIAAGDLFTVTNGSINAGRTYIQIADVSEIGLSAINFNTFTGITFSNFSTIQTPLNQIFNSDGFDDFYITYLRYCLADRICAEYNYDTPPGVMKQLSKYEAWINKNSRLLDLEMEKTSTLQKRYGLNWAAINIGRGYTVS